MKQDWQFVAMVLDRLFLWIFSAACIVGTFGIIIQAPTLYDNSPALGRPPPEPCDVTTCDVGQTWHVMLSLPLWRHQREPKMTRAALSLSLPLWRHKHGPNMTRDALSLYRCDVINVSQKWHVLLSVYHCDVINVGQTWHVLVFLPLWRHKCGPNITCAAL